MSNSIIFMQKHMDEECKSKLWLILGAINVCAWVCDECTQYSPVYIYLCEEYLLGIIKRNEANYGCVKSFIAKLADNKIDQII